MSRKPLLWSGLLVAVGLGVGTLAGLMAYAAPAGQTVDVEASEYAFAPAEMRAAAGEDLTIKMKNVGMAPHDIVFELDGGRVERTAVIRGGESVTLTFKTPLVAGDYIYYCSVGMHRARGMVGKLTVEPVTTVDVEASEYKFVPDTIGAKPGENLSIQMKNVGMAPHDIVFELDGGRVERTAVIRGGENVSLTFKTPLMAGDYVYYCSVGMHRARGMVGTLKVGVPPKTADVEASEYKYVPDRIESDVGQDLTIQMKNVGMAPHDIVFELDGSRVERTAVIRGGENVSLTFKTPLMAGTFVYYCSVGMHRARGMEGKLVVGGGGIEPTPTPGTPTVETPTPVMPTVDPPTSTPTSTPVGKWTIRLPILLKEPADWP